MTDAQDLTRDFVRQAASKAQSSAEIATQQQQPQQQSTSYLVREIENVHITMRDGVVLAGRLWLPVQSEGGDAPNSDANAAGHHVRHRLATRAQRSHSMPGAQLASLMLTASLNGPQFPGILEMIPYGKRHGTSQRDEEQNSYIASFGFACLRVDCRGTGESEGVLEDEYLPGEQLDAVDCIAWMRKQPWCTGKIGMTGISWGGFNSMQVAMLRPAGLEGIVALCCSENRYKQDVHYAGGCLLTDNIAWSAFMTAMLATPPDPALMTAEKADSLWTERLSAVKPWITKWLEHQWYDEYWKQGSLCEDWGAIGCSVLVASGWADGYRDMVPGVLEKIRLPEGKLARGINGPWAHNLPHAAAPGPNIDWLADVVSWWQYCLKGDAVKESEWRKRPAYTAYMEEYEAPNIVVSFRPGRWVAESVLPSARVRDWTLYIQRDHTLSPAKPEGAGGKQDSTAAAALQVPHSRPSSAISDDSAAFPAGTGQNEPFAYISSPLATGLDCGRLGYGQDPDYPVDQRNVDANSFCVETAPLADDLNILGHPKLLLHLSTSDPLAQVHVRVCDVNPRTGESVLVTSGLMNLTHCRSHEHATELKPGQVVRVDITLGEIGHVFPAGNRIRLCISTSLWPLVWPAPRKTTLGIHLSGDGTAAELTSLSLPVRPPDNQPPGDDTFAGASIAEEPERSNDDTAPVLPATTTATAAPAINDPSTTILESIPQPAAVTALQKTFARHQRSRSLAPKASEPATSSRERRRQHSSDNTENVLLRSLSPSLFRPPQTATTYQRTTLRESTLGTRDLRVDYVTGDTTLYLTKDYGHYRDENSGIERGDWTEEVFSVRDPKHRWGVEGTLGQTAWMEVRYGIELARSADWFRKLWQQGRTATLDPATARGWRIVVESKTKMTCTETHLHTHTQLSAWRYDEYDGTRGHNDNPLQEAPSTAEDLARRHLVFAREWDSAVPRNGL